MSGSSEIELTGSWERLWAPPAIVIGSGLFAAVWTWTGMPAEASLFATWMVMGSLVAFGLGWFGIVKYVLMPTVYRCDGEVLEAWRGSRLVESIQYSEIISVVANPHQYTDFPIPNMPRITVEVRGQSRWDHRRVRFPAVAVWRPERLRQFVEQLGDSAGLDPRSVK